MNFSEFILAHSGEDPAALALSRDRFVSQVPDFDLALTTLEVRRKLRDKVPEWYAVPSLVFPLRVSGEQCSSTATARYKASVAASLASTLTLTPQPALLAKNAGCHVSTDAAASTFAQKRGLSGTAGRLADLTGGLGVDSWAFAQVFEEVLYNEMRPELADAAAHNFQELGLTNITVRNYALVPGSMASSSLIPGSDPGSPASVSQILGSFHPDVLFLDPARRAADGRKVFRLEDCQPDVLQLLPELLAACPRILLKLSPMADITLVCKQIGCVKAVHVVAADGECKELLLVLEKDWSGPHTLTIVEDGAAVDVPDFGPSTAKTYPNCGRPPLFGDVYRTEPGSLRTEAGSLLTEPGSLLFEPGKALLKAGAFDLPCQFGLQKLGQHTHLYIGEEIPVALKPFGKCFRILEALPLDKRSIKAFGQKYPQAEVTARNIPLTSDQLRAKLGVRSGGSVHIFGLKIDKLGNYLLATDRII